MQVALADQGQTPASVLGEGMEHVVEEADARVDADGLGLAGLGGVAVTEGRGESRVGIGWECPAIQVDGKLDLGLVRVASESGPSGRVGGRRHFAGFFFWRNTLRLVRGKEMFLETSWIFQEYFSTFFPESLIFKRRRRSSQYTNGGGRRGGHWPIATR